MSDFQLSQQDININIWISTGTAFLSLICCSTVLALAYYVWTKPALRKMLDRVSFRLLLWSMGFEIVYDIAYIAVEFYSYYSIAGGLCASGVYFMMSTMSVVNYMCTAIAVNLMLTICFGLNPVRLGLERWYIGVSIFIGTVVPIAPAALGHFGYDPVLEVCWIQAEDDDTRMLYFILDLYLWQLLSCFIATVSVGLALLTLFRQSRSTSAALSGNPLNRTARDSPEIVDGEKGSEGSQTGLWGGRCKLSRCLTRPTSRGLKSDSTWGQLESKFFGIALRVSCYPIALIVVNGIITVADLYISKEGGVHSKAVYGLYCVYYALYGGRGMVFAALAFWIDPCFRRAIAAAWRHDGLPPALSLDPTYQDTTERTFVEMLTAPTPTLHDVTRPGFSNLDSELKSEEPISESMEKLSSASDNDLVPTLSHDLRSKRHDTRYNSDVSVDLPQALSTLAVERQGRLSTLSVTFSPHIGDRTSRSFPGVPSDHLPRDITDEIDIVDVRQSSLPLLRPVSRSPTDQPPELTGVGKNLATQSEKLEDLPPDLPDEVENERLRRRAFAEQRRAEREEAIRTFFETKALL